MKDTNTYPETMKAKVTYIKNEETGTSVINVLKEIYMAHKMNREQIIEAIKELYSDSWMPELTDIEFIEEEKEVKKSTNSRIIRHGYGEDEGEDQAIRLR